MSDVSVAQQALQGLESHVWTPVWDDESAEL